MHINSIITGTGRFLPEKRVPNSYFLQNVFHDKSGNKIDKPNESIIKKLEEISGIRERKYIGDSQDSAELATGAALRAIEDSGLSKESIDGIICAHNFGNLLPGESQGRLLPNLGAVVKARLDIQNHRCFSYDILFGCPGWLEGMIIAHQYIQSGSAENILVIGVEVISRLLDPGDLDSMLFGDGAGATILSRKTESHKRGILGHNTYSHCGEELDYLKMGYSPSSQVDFLTPKMQGRSVYRYGVTHIPNLIDECFTKFNLDPHTFTKFLFHQANEKMIKAIAAHIFKQYDIKTSIDDLVPFTVQETGNASVATIPTLLDEILKSRLDGHSLDPGQNVVMASVGAGMHCNCLAYQF